MADAPASAPTAARTGAPGAPASGFVDVARRLAAATRAAGLVVPVFRTPPRIASARRTIRWLPGGPVVSVRLRSRPLADVAADLVEGVIVANGLRGDAAAQVRRALRAALAAPGDSPRRAA
jgi:hypothetical protein